MVHVEMYSSRSCPYCIRAKTLLNNKGVRFQELFIDENPNYVAEAVERSGGRRTVPQIFIAKHHVGGYDDLLQLDREGKLDSMLGLNQDFAGNKV